MRRQIPSLALALVIGLAAGLAIDAGCEGLAARAAPAQGAFADDAALTKRSPLRAPPPAQAPRASSQKPSGGRSVPAPQASRFASDTGQCRLSCARSYYFCLADSNSDPCSGAWTRCLTGCSGGAEGW
jgi:hypothetical protein